MTVYLVMPVTIRYKVWGVMTRSKVVEGMTLLRAEMEMTPFMEGPVLIIFSVEQVMTPI